MDTRFVNVVVKGDSMWPTLSAGSTVRFERVEAEALEAGQVVLLDHPFRSDLRIIKRIQSIEQTQIFVVGDNPDLHDTFWQAAKLCSACKVEVSEQHAQELMDAVEAIHHMFWAAKGRDVPWIRAS